MKNGSQELILLKKEYDSNFGIIWPYFRICLELLLTKLPLFKNEQSYRSPIFRKRIKLIFIH